MTAPLFGGRCIVVALDPAAQNDAIDPLLEHVAARRAHRLIGVFVEDVRLLSMARSKLAREINLSGTHGPLEPTALERQIRVSAAGVRQRFEIIARRLGMLHDFRIARGEVIAEIEQAAMEAELLVVSVARQHAGARAWWGAAIYELARSRTSNVLFVHDRRPVASGPVIVWLEHGRDATALLSAAAELARGLRTNVVAAVSAHDARALDAQHDAPNPHITTLPVAAGDLPAVARLANRYDAAVLLLPARTPAADVERVRALLVTTRCALLLVDAASTVSV